MSSRRWWKFYNRTLSHVRSVYHRDKCDVDRTRRPHRPRVARVVTVKDDGDELVR